MNTGFTRRVRNMKSFLRICAVLAAIAATMSFSAKTGAFAGEPSTYLRQGDSIIWKIEGMTVWKFPTANAGEVSELSARFNRAYGAGFKLADLSVEKSDGKWSLLIGKNILYTVPPAYAKASGHDPKKLALNLMSRIYEIIGETKAAKLTPVFQIRGKYETSGSISWYGGKFIGRKFANGERFKETHLTAAAKTLPFGTLVKLTAPSGKTVVVRVTDRFKEHKNRVLDISHAAAELLGIKGAGAPKTKIEVMGRVDKIGGK
jgi:rare lipoprotein A